MKQIRFLCGNEPVLLRVPDNTQVYESHFSPAVNDEAQAVLDAVNKPTSGKSLHDALKKKRAGEVVVVVSDITRPIPYSRFLPQLLAHIEQAGVPREEIVILVATGMHRISTPDEHRRMFGNDVCERYEIVDHNAEDDSSLAALPEASWSGNRVKLNARFVNAGFRMITGLVEPHFMAGFSGGRKAVCPGLADLQTVRNFHGYAFLSNPASRNGNLTGNPLHEESLSVAKLVGVDFSLNVVLDGNRRIAGAFAGPLEKAHKAACDLARACTCPPVITPADILVTSSGGFPLDATFYQCVKGMVSCLPAVKPGGTIIAFGENSEGIGSEDYTRTMMDSAGKWRQFLEHIANPSHFVKDQWQYQMHCRTLEKVGLNNLHFITPGLSTAHLDRLSVTGHTCAPDKISVCLQKLFDSHFRTGATAAVLPEGPYCAPCAKEPLP